MELGPQALNREGACTFRQASRARLGTASGTIMRPAPAGKGCHQTWYVALGDAIEQLLFRHYGVSSTEHLRAPELAYWTVMVAFIYGCMPQSTLYTPGLSNLNWYVSFSSSAAEWNMPASLTIECGSPSMFFQVTVVP